MLWFSPAQADRTFAERTTYGSLRRRLTTTLVYGLATAEDIHSVAALESAPAEPLERHPPGLERSLLGGPARA